MKLILTLVSFVAFIQVGQLDAKNLMKRSFKVNIDDAERFCNGKCDPCANYKSGTILPIPNDYRRFNVCMNKVTETFQCATGYYFDHQNRKCTTITKEWQIIPQDKCEGYQIRRIADDCHSFEVCRNGTFIQKACPEGTYLNINLLSCQPVANDAQHKCSCLLPQNTVIPDADDCERYYVCDAGIAKPKQCRLGEYYNERISSCLPDLDGVCIIAPTKSPSELEASTTICSNNNDIFHPDETDCKKFIMCFNGRAISKSCATDFYYNPLLKSCLKDRYHNCGKVIPNEKPEPLVEDNIEENEDNDDDEDDEDTDYSSENTDNLNGEELQNNAGETAETTSEQKNEENTNEVFDIILGGSSQERPDNMKNEEMKVEYENENSFSEKSKESQSKENEKIENIINNEIKEDADQNKNLLPNKESYHKLVEDTNINQINDDGDDESVMTVEVVYKEPKLQKNHLEIKSEEDSTELKAQTEFLHSTTFYDLGSKDKLSSKFIQF